MKKRDWLLVIGSVFVVWFLDQVSKGWALSHLGNLKFYGPIGLVLHRNPGAILGSFSDLPPLLRVVSLSTGGAFLIFIYGAFQYFIPRRLMMLRLGMSLLLGGILGNVTDRIASGSVVDFISIGSPALFSPAFNFADAIQWVGYAMVVYALIRDGAKLWPTANERKKMWIMPAFQLKYCFMLMFIGLAFSLIAGVFAYTYLMVTIDDLVVGPSRLVERRFLLPFLEIYVLISLGFAIVLFLIGRVLSHRTAGPLYAFERFLDETLAGKDRGLRLRTGDEFKHLEELAERVRIQLRDNYQKTSGMAGREPTDQTTSQEAAPLNDDEEEEPKVLRGP
jgi:signal peptidase II